MPEPGEPRTERLPRPATTALSWVGLATFAPLAVFFVSCWLLGWRLQPVLTGSMSPTYDAGSLLVITPVDPSFVAVGSTIAFAPVDGGGRLVSHRVVERLERPNGDGLAFRTRGDANREVDAQLVPARQVRGAVRWHVVGLGTWLRWVRWPRGFFVFVLPAVLALAAGGVRDRLASRRRITHPTCPSCRVQA